MEDRDSIVASAVLMENTSTGGVCTGTLITPDLVLTAAHCVVDKKHPDNPIRASNFSLFFGNVQADRDASRPWVRADYFAYASQVVAHESYIKTRGVGDFVDLALIQFKAELPPGLRPAVLLPHKHLAAALQDGSRVTVAGFGRTSGKDDGREIRLRKVDLQVKDRSWEKDVQLVSRGPDHQGTCFGDSGGPAFVTIEHSQYLWGVNVRTFFDCSLFTDTVSLPNSYDWLAAKAKALGSTIPGIDGEFLERLLVKRACIDQLNPYVSSYYTLETREAEAFCQSSVALVDMRTNQGFKACWEAIDPYFWNEKVDAARICTNAAFVQNDLTSNPNFKTCWGLLRPSFASERIVTMKTCAARAMPIP